MKSAADIIDRFGGPTAFAAAIGTTQQNVTNMKARGTIPAAFFKAIISAAQERKIKDVTLVLLADLAANDWGRSSSNEENAA